MIDKLIRLDFSDTQDADDGNTSPETAYLIEDYPYSFTLR